MIYMYIYESNKYSWRKIVNRKYKIQNLFKTKTRQQLNNYQTQDQRRHTFMPNSKIIVN